LSETISQLPTTGGAPFLGDAVPITHGWAGASTGNTFAYTVAKLLSAGGYIYAGDPAYGVRADGATDDTSAWTSAFNAAFNASACVIAPLGVSLVSSLEVPSGVSIMGQAPGSTTGSGFLTGGSVISASSGTAPGVTLDAWSALRGVTIDGSGSQPCVYSSAGYNRLEDCTLFGGSSGVLFAGADGGSSIELCRIHDCGTAGILNAHQVTVESSYITNCGSGVVMTSSNNSLRMSNTRIEQSTNYGITADGPSGILLATTVIDNSGKNAIKFHAVSGSTITGCSFNRSGQGQVGSPGVTDDSHLYLQACDGVIITGNTSRTGSSTGYIGPFWAVYDGGSNVHSLIGFNGLTYHNNAGSQTSGPINIGSTFNLASAQNQTWWS